MINKEFFLKGFKSITTPDSPAIALGCMFYSNRSSYLKI